MNQDQDYLICCRVGDPLRAHVPSFLDHCDSCGHPVWRAYSSPRDIKAICLECAIANGPYDLKLEALTPEQWWDIVEYKKRSQ
jgi:hypothetical protein